MLYQFYEWNHAALAPWRAVAEATQAFYRNPMNPVAGTEFGRTVAAMAEVFERTTRVYGKPDWNIHDSFVDGMRVPVVDRVVWERPFCRLVHFERALPERRRADPRFLLVAPMSGHYATLLRGTVEALLPYGEVYITDWTDARTVPVSAGRFDLDDYVDHVIEMLHHLGPGVNVVGVCQPAVPVMMAVSAMSMDEDPCVPATMTLMGGPIDTRVNPTAVNRLAEDKGIDWFRDHVVMPVPFPHAGFGRMVYPGFLQLTGFMSMNLDRHLIAHKDFFFHLVKNDGDGAEKHRLFYDEYNAVMDLTAEFYLQTVEEVFINHSLPRGLITHRGRRLDMGAIRHTALLTVEGENDDISGTGQTEAAHALCRNLPDEMRVHYVQPKVGHYGVFNGSRFRAEIVPRMVDFALTHAGSAAEAVHVAPPDQQGAEADLPDADALGAGTAFTVAAALPDNPVRGSAPDVVSPLPGTAALEAGTALGGIAPDGDAAHVAQAVPTLQAPGEASGADAVLAEPRFADAERAVPEEGRHDET